MAQRSKLGLISLAGGIMAVAASAFFLWVLFIGRSQVQTAGWVFGFVIALASLAGLVGAIFGLADRLNRASALLWAGGGALAPAAALSAVAPAYLLLVAPSLLLLAGGALAERSLGGRRRFLWRWAVYLVLMVGLLFLVEGVYRGA